MKRITVLTFISLLLASLMLFSACSPTPAPKKEEKAKVTEAAKEEKTEAPTEAPTEKEKVEETEAPKEAPQVLNVYSSRHYDVDQEVNAMFEKETGIKINVVEGKAGELLERLTREKDAPQADLFLSVGAENISQLVEGDMLEAYSSDVIAKQIPEAFRGEKWMGVTARARIIGYVKDRVDPKDITSYDDLTKPEWEGKILVRSSSSSYNQALLASFISLNGEDKAREWAEGVVKNLAREPKGNDRDQAKAALAGEGDLAIMNSYYFVRMLNSSDPEEVKVAEEVGLIFPEDTHLNLSYAAVLKGAQHPENAVKFMEFLGSPAVQKLYVEKNGEFSLNEDVAYSEFQQSWGKFSPQALDFTNFGKEKPAAMLIFDEIGWK